MSIWNTKTYIRTNESDIITAEKQRYTRYQNKENAHDSKQN